MGSFFSIDGPFYKFGSVLADMMILGLLWFICSLPVFTMGASTTALFYVMTKRISDKEGYITRDFFSSFKSNFKVATLTWLTVLLAAFILFLNINNIDVMGNMRDWILPFQYVFVLELSFITIFMYPLLARFEMTYFSLIKTAFFMANRHLLTTILCVVLLLAGAMAVYMMPPVLLIVAGFYAMLASYLFIRVFRKYHPEIDKDPDYDNLHPSQKTGDDAPAIENDGSVPEK